MIYTVTFNPSLDYRMDVNEIELGMVNRSESESMLAGGKGINVSVVLKNLGYDTIALGFLAGFTGEEIRRRVESYGCTADFISLKDGISRINVKLNGEKETEINGQGPVIAKKEIEQLFEKLDYLVEGDFLVLAGSIPGSLPDDIYEKIMERLSGKGIQIVVDATKELLMNVLKYHPFLIKPNNHELGEVFGVKLTSREDVIPYALKMQELGARNVLVSMAGEGAVLVSEDGQVRSCPAPKGTVVNSVGAGDSMVAGFLAGYLAQKDYTEAFYLGIATGSASAFSKNLATKKEVMELVKTIQ